MGIFDGAVIGNGPCVEGQAMLDMADVEFTCRLSVNSSFTPIHLRLAP